MGFIVFSSSAFVISLLGYTVTALKASYSSPGGVPRKYWRRSVLYLVNFLLTYTLIIIGNINMALLHNHVYRFLADGAQSLNGFANVLTYFVQSRYARMAFVRCGADVRNAAPVDVRSSRSLDLMQTMNVRFGGLDEIPLNLEQLLEYEAYLQLQASA